MNKMEDLINMTKLNELLNKKEEVEEKKTSKVVWIFNFLYCCRYFFTYWPV